MKNYKLFIRNGLILTLSALFLRTVSVIFNVYITSAAGAEGTGLFQLVMSLYSPALTLASAGVSLASSRLIAEELSKSRGGRWHPVLVRCIICAVTFSLPVTAALYLLAPYVSEHWLGTSLCSPLLRMLSLGMPFISLSSCISGFFIALRRAEKNAFLQVSEQLFKMSLTYILICNGGGNGVKTLLYVVFGNVISDIFAFCLSMLLYTREKKRLKIHRSAEKDSITPRILSITLPVSISSFLRSALVAFEHILIPKGLKKSGLPYTAAMASYGTLTGMAMPIIFFPASFLYSFSSLTVPEMAEAKEKGDYREIEVQIQQILLAFLTFAIGASAIIFSYSYELGDAIYKSAEASIYLTYLAPLIPFMYLDTAVDSMLKGLGEQIFTMKVNVIDALCSVISVYFLVPKLGIMGYIAVILISELINFSFSVYRLKKVTKVKLGLMKRVPTLLVFIFSSIGITRLFILRASSSLLRACIGIPVSILLYCLFLAAQSQKRDKVIKTNKEPYNLAKKGA